MIKAVLFDYDGVITAGVDIDMPAKRLAHELKLPVARTSAWLTATWVAFSTARMSEAEVWTHIEEQHGVPITQKLRDIWFRWEELTPLPEMLALVTSLKERGYKTGILSNVSKTTGNLIHEHGGYDGYDLVVLSCEAGVRKPDHAIYEIALKKLKGILPEEVLFLDDRENNIITAQELGMQTIHVTDHKKSIKEVEQLLR